MQEKVIANIFVQRSLYKKQTNKQTNDIGKWKNLNQLLKEFGIK